ncbi:hypothetical protein M0R45_035104 [Rubus argutus]|uniref:UV-B-induced protein At3g17800, chloroplastic-like n=1 Tax=Rubus argutus TaxID=59490 RepID=A0AAW1VWC2_RUBAR
MEHYCLSHHKLLTIPTPISTLKPRITHNFSPKYQTLTKPSRLLARASSRCEFKGHNSPLDPRSRSGKDLSSVLQNQPQLFHLAVTEELKQLANEREDALSRMNLSASSDEACLHRRIAQLKEQQCQIAVEDVMYLLIFYKFSEVKVPLVPKLSRCIYYDRLEILPAKDWELESIYSLEVLEMIREHVTSIIHLRANSSVTDNWALTKITPHMLGRQYVASILYGYFLKSVSLRHCLERSLFLESQDLHLSCRTRTALQEMCPHDGNLESYVMGFDPESRQRRAKLRSEEAVNLIINHCYALFGDDTEMSSLETDDVITTSFSSLKRLVLEAVAFGSFLWDTEESIDSVYKLKENQRV